MLRFFKSFFNKKNEPVSEPAVKVEAPVVSPTVVPAAPAQCGCGRSATGLCVGLHKLSQEEWAAHPDNPVKPVVEAAPAKKPAVKKAPAKKKPAASKPAAITAAPKKPRAKKEPK